MPSSITFAGTSKTDLLIRPIDPQRYVPLQNMEQVMKGWIPYQARKGGELDTLSELHCAPGSSFDNTTTGGGGGGGGGDTLPTYSGLIGTILTAYNLHQNLVLRPDDIFVLILAQFSTYVNGRAEELRSKFVGHEGQIELEVGAAGTACAAPYADMTRTFLDEIAKNLLDPTLRDWFLPGFSTTTFKDEVVASASAMCAFQSYFTYTYSLECGIPQIKLEGTVDDWKLLRAKVEKLIDFDDKEKVMEEQWVPLLRTILDNFVETVENGTSSNNQKFWNSIVQYYEHDVVCATETHLTGWLSTFTFFNGQGQVGVEIEEQLVWPRIKLDSINHNVVSCPVKIDDNGIEYNATLYVGSMAFEYIPTGLEYADFPTAVQTPENQNATLHTLIPRTDWAMAVWERQEEEEDAAEQQGVSNSFRDTHVMDAVQRGLARGEQCTAAVTSDAGTDVTGAAAMPSMAGTIVDGGGAPAFVASGASSAAGTRSLPDGKRSRQVWVLMTMVVLWMISVATNSN